MGQKVDPRVLRIKINKHWVSRWYAKPRNYAETLHEDLRLREAILKSPLTNGGEISHIDIIRYPEHVSLIINTGRPGVIIGVKGENIEKISKILQPLTTRKIQIKINEESRTEINAQIVAQNVARLLRTRSTFRRVMKMAMENAMRAGALGIKMKISGRLGGADMSRSVLMIKGRVPLHTLRADIDYGFAESFTAYGTTGVKVWIFKGEIYKYHAADPSNLLSDRRHRDNKRYPGGPGRREKMGGGRRRERATVRQKSSLPESSSPAGGSAPAPEDQHPASRKEQAISPKSTSTSSAQRTSATPEVASKSVSDKPPLARASSAEKSKSEVRPAINRETRSTKASKNPTKVASTPDNASQDTFKSAKKGTQDTPKEKKSTTPHSSVSKSRSTSTPTDKASQKSKSEAGQKQASQNSDNTANTPASPTQDSKDV